MNNLMTSLEPTPVATHCPYCAMQCGMLLAGTGTEVSVQGNNDFPVNKGSLCIKGWTSAETLNHSERLLSPLARNEKGKLVPVTWDEALNRIAVNFTETEFTELVINPGNVNRIPFGEGREFQIGDEEIVIFRTRKNQVFGLQAKCPRREGTLADGLTGDGKVICPMHAYKFELATGHPVGNDCESLKTYQVEVSESGEILLHWSSKIM